MRWNGIYKLKICIFRPRCRSCHLITLHSKKHNCTKIRASKNQILIEKIWQYMNKHEFVTLYTLAIEFGIMKHKIKNLIDKNPKLFACYYPKGHNYYCTRITRIKLNSQNI